MAAHQEPCEICERLAQCRAGTHPGLIAELDTGYAVLGDSQQFRGYCLLLAKAPVTELDELAPTERLRLLEINLATGQPYTAAAALAEVQADISLAWKRHEQSLVRHGIEKEVAP